MADIAAIARFGLEFNHAYFLFAALLHDLSNNFDAAHRWCANFGFFSFIVRDEERVRFDLAFGFVDFSVEK